jgi:hypothetical protein
MIGLISESSAEVSDGYFKVRYMVESDPIAFGIQFAYELVADMRQRPTCTGLTPISAAAKRQDRSCRPA